MNSNIRCIEINRVKYTGISTYMLNSNIRCIEMIMTLCSRSTFQRWIVTLDVLKSVSGVPKSGVKAVE